MPLVAGTQYATTTDLGNVGLTSAALATMTTGQQTAALAGASALVDSYLESRYTLPLTAWGSDLARCVAILAAYDLLSTRGYNPNAGADMNWRQRYVDQMAWLDEVSKGTSSPSQVADSSVNGSHASTSTGADGSISTTTAGGFSVVTSPVRGWTNRGATKPGWEP